MEGIDPRLRQAPTPNLELPNSSPADLVGGAVQHVGYAAQLPQHRYYSNVPTPGSYSDGAHQEPPGSPYNGPHDGQHDCQPQPDGADLGDLKRARACEACRQLKVRCEPADGNFPGSCRRCFKADRQCIVTAPSRKRQKKTDSRVADLEKKIDALTATLQTQHGPYGMNPALDSAVAQAQMAELEQQRNHLYNQQSWQDGAGDSPETSHSNALSPLSAGAKRKVIGEDAGEQPSKTATVPNPSYLPNGIGPSRLPGTKDGPANPFVDVIDRKIIDAHTAYRVFDRYHNEMRLLPVVVFPPDTKAEDIRHSKPLLFLAILAAASSTICSDLQPTFLTELMRLLATRIFLRGEKSFELLQALQITIIFYQPPERHEELNFNQLIHVAAVMGIDLGMGRRNRARRAAPDFSRMPVPDPDATETRRAWLGIYHMCANAAMSLRRPLLIRWSTYMDESLEMLDKAPDALPSDKWLIYLVRVQHIAEEVSYQFSMDDPSTEVSITDIKIQYQMKAFERQLEECRRFSTPDMPQALLKHNEAIMDLYVHEIGMHNARNLDDFRFPYGVQDETQGEIEGEIAGETADQPDYITPAHIHSLTVCLESIHKAFDAVINMPLSTIRALPTLFVVRNSYAAVALIKMYNAVSRPGSKFGSVFKPKDLKVDYYLDALLQIFKRANEHAKSPVTMKFIFVFGMLREWQTKREIGVMNRNKTQPAGGVNPQDPKTASWSAPAGATDPALTLTPNYGRQARHPTGLQMLSEVAMGNDKNTVDSASIANNSHWTSQTLPPQLPPSLSPTTSMQQNQHCNPHSPNSTSNTANTAIQGHLAAAAPPPPPRIPTPGPSLYNNYYGGLSGMGTEIDNFALSAEDMNVLGSMMDDPGWLSFGLDGGGWVM